MNPSASYPRPEAIPTYVTILRTEIDVLGWREGQKLLVRRVGKRIIVEHPKRAAR